MYTLLQSNVKKISFEPISIAHNRPVWPTDKKIANQRQKLISLPNDIFHALNFGNTLILAHKN
jgi:hypothetical protein